MDLEKVLISSMLIQKEESGGVVSRPKTTMNLNHHMKFGKQSVKPQLKASTDTKLQTFGEKKDSAFTY